MLGLPSETWTWGCTNRKKDLVVEVVQQVLELELRSDNLSLGLVLYLYKLEINHMSAQLRGCRAAGLPGYLSVMQFIVYPGWGVPSR